MATSMAAALAASLPAPQAASSLPAAPTYEAIPASMSKVIDIEAEIPITSVQLDALVVTKIIKHARESPTASGLLLGLDLDGTLEISNSFPVPITHNDSEQGGKSSSAARYQASMLRALKEIQADDSVVGFYQSASLGAFFRQSLVDMQASNQSRLRHGGVVLVHDVSKSARGNATFRAFRLTPDFLEAHKKGKFNVQSLIDHRLTFSNILEEIPLVIHNSVLVNAFLATLTSPTATAAPDVLSTTIAPPNSALPHSFAPLDLDLSPLITRNLEHLVDGLDDLKNEEGNLAYLSRQIAREKARADAHVLRRKEENATRVAQGLAPLPEDDVSRLFKIPPEPSRLESMLLLAQIDAYSKSLEEVTSNGLVKMYSARSGTGV